MKTFNFYGYKCKIVHAVDDACIQVYSDDIKDVWVNYFLTDGDLLKVMRMPVEYHLKQVTKLLIENEYNAVKKFRKAMKKYHDTK